MVDKGSGFRNGLISFDDPNNVYYSGQHVSGKINFELNNPLSLLYLNVTYNGEANVQWIEEESETYNGVRRKKEIKYVGREVYLDFTQCLIGGTGVTVLPTGPHSFPFSCQVPFTAPSSFKGEKGDITYKIIAFVIHRDGVTKEVISKEFKVIAPLDLNTEEIKKPIQMDFEEVYSCACSCSPQPLAISIRVPHAGFCPGQVIPFTVDAKNNANVEVTKIKFEVIMKMRYLSQQPMSAVMPPHEVVVSMVKGPILSKNNKQYQFEMKLPDFVALNFDNCGIIDVGYFLKVTMKVSGCNDDMTDEAEVCLGLVPIGSNVDVRVSHPMGDYLPISPIPTQNNPDTQPPPYEGFQNVQICPPAPVPYPAEDFYNNKGAYESNRSHTQNVSPVPGYPGYPPQYQNLYSSYPQSQSMSYPSPNSAHIGFQVPNLPPGQCPEMSPRPSAPPL